MEFGSIARSADNSFFRELQTMAGSTDYGVTELEPSESKDFILSKQYRFVNLEDCFREGALPIMDELSEEARLSGAVDAVFNDGGRLIGHNTECFGVKALFAKAGADPAGKNVLVLGDGFSRAAAAAAARAMGAAKVDALPCGELGESVCAGVQVLIYAPDSGVCPDIDLCPAGVDRFPALEAVLDLTYEPIRSRLVLSALKKGITARGGLYAKAAAAAFSQALFTGSAYSDFHALRIYEDTLYSRLNLVLIGMPSCGKTTVGERAAEIMGRRFVDTDRAIVARDGRTVSSIIKAEGEEYFRSLENGQIRREAAGTGMVIASGGGSILNEENVTLLKMNGKLIFLDRPLEELTVSKDRPISDSRKKLDKLYAARLPIYKSAADRSVSPSWVVDDTVRSVLRVFWE